MSTHNREIHGHKVYNEDDAREGVEYLANEIQLDEAKVFFDQAKLKGLVQFEDRKGNNYSLLYKQDGFYWVYKRKPDSHGWF